MKSITITEMILVENGMKLSGISPDGRIVEMVEVEDHPWF